jgi:chorismate mutase/prephenate dehydratase
MEELQELRCQIDGIDRQLADLFRQRMTVTEKIGEYKAAHGLQVLDRARENQVLAAKAALVGDELRADVTTLFETIMALSRRQQAAIVGGNQWIEAHRAAWSACRVPPLAPRVLYQGEPGAYADEAAARFFGEDCDRSNVATWEDIFVALKDGKADYGVLPIENSSTGSINQVYDLLAKYGAYIVGEQTIRVDHCLMAPKGSTLDTVREVCSHEQGLFQCEDFLKEHPSWKRKVMLNTAAAAKFVADSGDVTLAAIGSRQAARLYGLEVLAQGVNTNRENFTRFVVVSPLPELREGRNKISAMFTLAHESGTLHRIMTVFATGGLNLMKLESRPIPGRSWEYRFFVDFTGDLVAYGMDSILREMSQCAATLRVLGNYKADDS